jgi:hypothetical protein
MVASMRETASARLAGIDAIRGVPRARARMQAVVFTVEGVLEMAPV